MISWRQGRGAKWGVANSKQHRTLTDLQKWEWLGFGCDPVAHIKQSGWFVLRETELAFPSRSDGEQRSGSATAFLEPQQSHQGRNRHCGEFKLVMLVKEAECDKNHCYC